MRPSGGHFGGQALAVGGAQLLHLAVAQKDLDDRMLAAQQLEGAGVGREPGLGLAHRGEAEFLVEHGAQLGHRVHLERLAGQVLDGGLERAALVGQPGRDRAQDVAVDAGCRPPPCGPAPGPGAVRCPRRGCPPPPPPAPRSAGRATGPAPRPAAPQLSTSSPRRSSPSARSAGGSRTNAPWPLAPVPSSTITPRKRTARSAEPVVVGRRDRAGRRRPRCPVPGRPCPHPTGAGSASSPWRRGPPPRRHPVRARRPAPRARRRR